MKIKEVDNKRRTAVLKLSGMDEKGILYDIMSHSYWYEYLRLKYRLMNFVSIFSEHPVYQR